MIEVEYIKFGSAVMVAGKTSMFINTNITKSCEIKYHAGLHLYELKSTVQGNTETVIVHSTNVQWVRVKPLIKPLEIAEDDAAEVEVEPTKTQGRGRRPGTGKSA